MQDYRYELAGADTSAMAPEEYAAIKAAAEKKEKTELFVSASFLAILLLLYDFFNFLFARVFWLAAYTRYTGRLSFDLDRVREYFTSELPEASKTTAFNMTGSVFIVAASSLSIFIIGQFIMKIKLSEILKPYKTCVTDGIRFFPTTLTFNLMAGMLVTIISTMLREDGITLPESDFSMTSPTGYELFMQFMYICVIGPICEEFIYRGLCIKLLSPFGSGLAVTFSAVAFGVMHGNVKQALPAMLTGFVYALVAVRYGSIVPTIIIHILNNIAASVTDYGNALGWTNTDVINRVINIVMLFLGFYGIIVLFTELLEKVYSDEPKCALPYRKRFFSVWTNVFCVIYFIYLFWEFIEKIINANLNGGSQ